MKLTPERWQQIARIFELAVEVAPASRDEFLSNSCANDDGLRREVESLLRQDDASVVLDRPVWQTAAPLFDDSFSLGPGTTLGPYRIETLLGAGGMGEVFAATDTRLHRRVAVKVLPGGVAEDQEVRARFAREAEAVAALTHPHICTLYDIGRHDNVDFLVMEYLEGDTLAARLAEGPLPFGRALVYAKEIASALNHAHSQGIIHRDLKPANIMLTGGGAKLLDFGLAKFRTAPGRGLVEADETRSGIVARPPARTVMDPISDSHLTRGDAILGTIRYMAPEQITGHEVDARTDLFSFGAVLFEMLTGKRAFDGGNVAGVLVAVLEREPPSVSSIQPPVPPAIDAITRRCLAKDPDARWQKAGDLLRELERVSETTNAERTRTRASWQWVAAIVLAAIAGLSSWLFTGLQDRSPASTVGEIRAIAVLPFEHLSNDPGQDYFADGMTEQLIANLAAISGLRVISRTSVMYYKNARKPVPTIARELQVDGIIEGTVIRAGENVRLTAKLIRGVSGEVLWVQNFERDLRDVLTLQHEVVRAIATEVGINLTPQEQVRLTTARPLNPDALNQVLLGRYHTAKATEEGLRKGVQYFDVAISMDPGNALAHAGLAEAYAGLNGFYMDPQVVMPKAKQAVETALRLDESLADAHATLGYIHLVYDWDGPSAEKEFLRALDLNPTLAMARLWYAAYLTSQARYDDAVGEIRRAVELDPMSIRTHTFGTLYMMFTRRYDEAIELARRGLEFEPNSAFTLAFQGVAFAEQRRFTEAIGNLQRAVQLDKSPTIRALQAHVLAVAGQKAQAQELVRQLEDETRDRYFCPYEIGTVYVSLGNQDTATEWFRKGVKGRADCMAWLGIEPWLDPFRSDPRYKPLLRQIGLTPSER